MVQLRDKETGALLGSISDEELQFLVDNLEEEWDGDTDYYLNGTTIEMLNDAGADEGLIELLTKALGDKEGVEIEWLKS
jgi:processive 1,2-diacylglycerol beta-glucosyltransferase